MDTIETRMLKARVKLLLEQPLFGQMILHLEMQEAKWCKTAATDGRKFYYNRDFIDRLTNDELLFIHGHEVMHCILRHVFRRNGRKKGLFNMAADYICNYILKANKVGKMPQGGLWDAQYTDAMSVDQVYALLDQNNVKVKDTLDVHLEPGDGQDDDEDLPVFSADEIEEIEESFQVALAQAARCVGNLPAGLDRYLLALSKPKINWREQLASELRSTVKYDYTYTKVSRRSWSHNLIIPGQDVEDRINVAAWLDASGSMSDEMVSDFLGEIRGILSQFRDFELLIGTFDTKTYNVKSYTPRNAKEINTYKVKGGGGTIPSCCWEYMKKNKIKPNKLLMFTDGIVGSDWGDPFYCDAIFIVHSNPHIKSSYGKTLHYTSRTKS